MDILPAERRQRGTRARALERRSPPGQRAYYAQRLLLQFGLDAKNLSGGFTTYAMMRAVGPLP